MESHSKALKERSMNEKYRSRFEAGLQKISDSLTKKGDVKQEDKVHQRIGRLKQKYPSIQRYFNIEVEVKEDVQIKREKKQSGVVQENKNIVASIKWAFKEGVDINASSGVYFLRTSVEANTQGILWQFYDTIREIEATLRVLKTDLTYALSITKKMNALWLTCIWAYWLIGW